MGYWFARKRYGWGWEATSKEGWTIIALYIALIVVWADLFMPDKWEYYTIAIVLQTALLLLICYKKSKPYSIVGK